MDPQDVYALELGSDRFIFLCTKLNATTRQEDADWSYDVFSGGFKFSDEIPDDVQESPDLLLPLVTLLRQLWAHRMSLIEGSPRPDLAPTWELARRLAPRWVGFSPERCSPSMQSIVDESRLRGQQFCRDIERLEARLRRDRDVEKSGPENGHDGSADGNEAMIVGKRPQ
jgi:hypothetical protein